MKKSAPGPEKSPAGAELHRSQLSQYQDQSIYIMSMVLSFERSTLIINNISIK